MDNHNQRLHDLKVWLKAMEIEALARAGKAEKVSDFKMSYWSGKAEAYSNAWEQLVFGPEGAANPNEYNSENEFWSDLADKAFPGASEQ